MNNTEKRKWTQLFRAVLFAICVSSCILLLLFSFSFFVGSVSDGAILVSVLGVLVTALIGWQISTMLGIDRRVNNAEKRIEKMMSELRSAQNAIDKTAKSSEDYTSGVSYLSIAMLEYVQTRFNRNLPIEDKVRHYCTCYMASAQAIQHLLNSQKDDDVLFTSLCLCVQSLSLSSEILFDRHHIVLTKMEFTQEDHKLCNKYYKFINKKRKSLGIENIIKIEDIHNTRIKLLIKNPNPSIKH